MSLHNRLYCVYSHMQPAATERDQRIDSTRVDAESLVDELFGGVSLDDSQPGESWIFIQERVKWYPTMFCFEIPRHTWSMIPNKFSNEFF